MPYYLTHIKYRRPANDLMLFENDDKEAVRNQITEMAEKNPLISDLEIVAIEETSVDTADEDASDYMAASPDFQTPEFDDMEEEVEEEEVNDTKPTVH